MSKNNKQPDMPSKKQVGIFSFTCDEGCSIFLIEIFNQKLIGWLDKIELAYFLSVRQHNEIKNFDIALVEGVISTKKDEELIKKIRRRSRVLIAMGSCAISALPSGQRNNFSANQLEQIKGDLEKFDFLPKCLAVKEVVKVDDEVPGCPIDKQRFIEVFEKYI
jgi:coenzyme F420-reducing hydrogenase gamma subunit